MSDFKTVSEVMEYLHDLKWHAKDRDTPLNKRTIYLHITNGYLSRESDGSFSQVAVDQYANDFLESDANMTAKNSLSEAIDRERLRKLQIDNDLKCGGLVSLSEEIKRRVAVLQGMKSSLINGRATFIRQLRDGMKKRNSHTLDDLLHDAADLYADCVEDVFDEIGKAGKI